MNVLGIRCQFKTKKPIFLTSSMIQPIKTYFALPKSCSLRSSFWMLFWRISWESTNIEFLLKSILIAFFLANKLRIYQQWIFVEIHGLVQLKVWFKSWIKGARVGVNLQEIDHRGRKGKRPRGICWNVDKINIWKSYWLWLTFAPFKFLWNWGFLGTERMLKFELETMNIQSWIDISDSIVTKISQFFILCFCFNLYHLSNKNKTL